ncbi:MAG: ATP-binding protein [Kiritimatiellia bacterium]|jgi:signal transduction histidine kinase|nr:ATP-binding protein [Kiritimatiellia bacterium]
MALLTWHTGTRRRQLTLGEITVIGRGAESDVVLESPQVSRRHARIRHLNADWLFEDQGSHNGSLINGQLRTQSTLTDGDVITLGPFQLTFAIAPATRPPVPRPDIRARDSANDLSEPLSAMASLDLSRAHAPAAQDTVDLHRRLQASYEIARATAATLDESELLEQVLEALFEIFEMADRGMILLVDRETGALIHGPARQREGDVTPGIEVSDTALKRALDTREAVLCCNTRDDSRLAAAQSIVTLGIRSVMIAPLLFREKLYGAIYLDARQRTAAFHSTDLQLLCAAAADVAAALAHAELHSQVVQNERMAAIGETAAGLSHCIKNILQAVKTGSYLLDHGLEREDLEMIGKGWQVIKKKNDFMEKLVWDLLTLSKPREAEHTPVDLNALCEEICDVGTHREEGEPVSVTFKPDPTVPPVALDAQGIRRSLLNLVTNAMDACADTGGEVTVETHVPDADGRVSIAIRDTGCGMSAETQAKLFTVFFSTKGSRGTGLGLPVTRKIVEEHGGTLDVTSAEGTGTTFTITLPITPAQSDS